MTKMLMVPGAAFRQVPKVFEGGVAVEAETCCHCGFFVCL